MLWHALACFGMLWHALASKKSLCSALSARLRRWCIAVGRDILEKHLFSTTLRPGECCPAGRGQEHVCMCVGKGSIGIP